MFTAKSAKDRTITLGLNLKEYFLEIDISPICCFVVVDSGDIF